MRELQSLTELPDERPRSLTAENPDGTVGAGGQAENHLGVGRKGRPAIPIASGETASIADVDGPGEIRHVWITVPDSTDAGDTVLRDLTLRAYWDGESDPSVEVPLGDFFASGHAARARVDSHPVVVAPDGGLNCYWSMPFREGARITVENEHGGEIPMFFYQIDYVERDVSEEEAYFHAQWRRENTVTRGEDYTILDGVEGEGQYVGTYLAWTALEHSWWGEGEVKFYLDGDEAFPTICGTGTEDYVGGAWCFAGAETYSTPYLGYPYFDDGEEWDVPKHGLYRWHVPDPIRFDEDLRVTVQDIGHDGSRLYERADDIGSVAYWYQREPHVPFPDYPDREERLPR